MWQACWPVGSHDTPASTLGQISEKIKIWLFPGHTARGASLKMCSVFHWHARHEDAEGEATSTSALLHCFVNFYNEENGRG